MTETTIERTGNFGHPYGLALQAALEAAQASESKLSEWVLQLEGMSGRRYRHLINTLVGEIEGARYLEVGSWGGSTACAAMFGNRLKATCIDNWSEFGGPRDTFFETTGRARSDQIDFRFVESDFRAVDYSGLGRFNLYLFDGPHTYADQYDGLALARPALDRTYVQIVDDWNWDYVRGGTREAIDRVGLREICAIQIRTTQDNRHSEIARQHSDWHNGYYIAVLQRP